MARKPAPASDEGRRKSRRLSDVAYGRILENLFDRQLPAGAFVSQSDLVALLGIPVGPLRDALRVLEAEGILRIRPRSGIEFVKPGLELTRATYQFRTIIERAAVRVFAETAPSELLEELRAEHAALVARVMSSEIDPEVLLEFERLEARLHNSIVGIMSNPLIELSYRRMHNYLRLVRLDRRMTAPLALRSLNEHIQIIEACIERDADHAEAAVRAHFSAALQRHLGIS